MFKDISYKSSSLAPRSGDISTIIIEDSDEIETGAFEIIGTGEIRVKNTGGSSASEGGMGSDSDTDNDKAKGDLTEPGQGKGGNRSVEEDDSDITFDPIKKNVREAEKRQSNE